MTGTERADVAQDEPARAAWIPAYVALGSNLDDPGQQVERAFDALASLPRCRLVLRSACYRSRPLGPVAQPDFVNAVAGLLTQLDAATLLQELKSLESTLGRAAPIVRWGPRRIDLDLLVHGSTRRQEPKLQVPHPGIAGRAFVLAPLCDVSPDLLVPGVGRVRDLLARLDAGGLERIDR
ncbi:MAG TPA: 2-amino-4-hydroxy-6-hydroxymethyldihydropteridine diphosphokinase [Steroidobacteraceae bacterium]|nr:2-amino-4-hydroxy-6-hydroxymethyldihydropteridine diphosphokinase [Steroidobacteraceae bacterium]